MIIKKTHPQSKIKWWRAESEIKDQFSGNVVQSIVSGEYVIVELLERKFMKDVFEENEKETDDDLRKEIESLKKQTVQLNEAVERLSFLIHMSNLKEVGKEE